MHPNQPISSLGGQPSSWPSRAPTYHPFGVQLDAGQLISRTFSLWSDDFWRLVGINALPLALMLGLGVVGGVAAFALYGVGIAGALDGNIGDAMLLPLIAGGVGFSIVCGLLYVAGQVGSYVAVEEMVRGEPRRIGAFAAIGAGLSSMPAVIGIYLFFGVLSTLLMSPVMGLGVAAAVSESWMLGGAAALVAMPCFVLLCYASLRLLTVAPVAAVIEELGPIAALRRSLELTKGNTVDLFIAALVFGCAMFGINMVVGFFGLIPFLGIFVQLAAMVLFGALQSVWLTLAYAGLRDRLGN